MAIVEVVPDKGGTPRGRFYSADRVAPDIPIGVGAVDEYEMEPLHRRENPGRGVVLCDVGERRVRDDRLPDASIPDQVGIVLGQVRKTCTSGQRSGLPTPRGQRDRWARQ